jgi:hypothetical protein
MAELTRSMPTMKILDALQADVFSFLVKVRVAKLQNLTNPLTMLVLALPNLKLYGLAALLLKARLRNSLWMKWIFLTRLILLLTPKNEMSHQSNSGISRQSTTIFVN